MKNFLSTINNSGNKSHPSNDSDKKIKKCNSAGSDEIDLSGITDKCYGCNADKLEENENYIRKDFE
jgi:hypothetical protein